MLRYPRERISGDYDYLEIQVVRYTPPGLGNLNQRNEVFRAPSGTSKNFNPPASRIIETIALPMPNGVVDNNSVNWTEDRLNAFEAAGLGLGNTVLENNRLPEGEGGLGGIASGLFGTALGAVQGGGDILGRIFNDTNARTAGRNELLRRAVNQLGGNVSAQGLLSRAQGQVLNPNLELLFRGVNLRNFDFTFTMSPRERGESEEIKKIIRVFKENMAAKNTSSQGTGRGIFIAAPNVFNLTFKRGGQKHPFLNSFKTVALRSTSVNYSAQGRYATYEDASPVQLTLQLNFTELNPIYSEDYQDNQEFPGINQGVGF